MVQQVANLKVQHVANLNENGEEEEVLQKIKHNGLTK